MQNEEVQSHHFKVKGYVFPHPFYGTGLTPKHFLPHEVPNSWKRRNNGGGGVVAKPDWLVAFQTLGSERIQQVHLSL